ncbi:MAG: enolase C-terminal domain-like protein [Pirellulaceae bacterium]|nr:hypothetical protein [Planctomycetales bacterium]
MSSCDGLPPVKIRKVRAITTAPDGIRLVVDKVETDEPELYGLGCATFNQRPLAVVEAVNSYLDPFARGRSADNIEDLEQYHPFFIEDPLAPEKNGYFTTMRQQTSCPTAIGELFNNPDEWVELISNRLIDFIRVHLSQIGGLTPARKLATLAEHFAVRSAWHGPGDVSPVGHACNAQLDLAISNFGIQEGPRSSDRLQEVFPGCPEMWGILTMVILPIVGGLIAGRILTAMRLRGPWLDRLLSIFAMSAICLIIAIITSLSRDQLLSVGIALILASILHNGFGYLPGYCGAWLLGLDESDRRTVAIEIGLQNGVGPGYERHAQHRRGPGADDLRTVDEYLWFDTCFVVAGPPTARLAPWRDTLI